MEPCNTTTPLLSIVIATRNRVPYAISAILSILEISDARLELVVQDNSESRDLESYVRCNVRDSRFRYRYTPPPFSSIDNFNAAVELATGEYVCLIGDDDGVNPEIMDAAEWAKRENIDSLGVRNVANYSWPKTGVPPTLFTKITEATLQVSPFKGYLIDADCEKEMRALIRNGALYYLFFKLPKLYHGLVHRRCLAAVHSKVGNYFGGLSPDIFSSLAIVCVAKRVVITDYPLTIPGVCRASTSVTEGPLKKPSKDLKDAPHFRDRGDYQWCELVPRFYATETIWADSAVAALRAMGREDLVRQLNLPKLAAYCVGANRGVINLVMHDLLKGLQVTGKSRVIGIIRFACCLLTGPGTKFAHRAWVRLLVSSGIRVPYIANGLQNMVEATHSLTCYLEKNGHRFSDLEKGSKISRSPLSSQ